MFVTGLTPPLIEALGKYLSTSVSCKSWPLFIPWLLLFCCIQLCWCDVCRPSCPLYKKSFCERQHDTWEVIPAPDCPHLITYSPGHDGETEPERKPRTGSFRLTWPQLFTFQDPRSDSFLYRHIRSLSPFPHLRHRLREGHCPYPHHLWRILSHTHLPRFPLLPQSWHCCRKDFLSWAFEFPEMRATMYQEWIVLANRALSSWVSVPSAS